MKVELSVDFVNYEMSLETPQCRFFICPFSICKSIIIFSEEEPSEIIAL